MKLFLLLNLFSSFCFGITCNVTVTNTKTDDVKTQIFESSSVEVSKNLKITEISPTKCGINIGKEDKLKSGEKFTLVTLFCNLSKTESYGTNVGVKSESEKSVVLTPEKNGFVFEIEAKCK